MVGIYVRVSTQEQAQHGYSIEEQQERLIKYCEAMKWPVYDVYIDAGYSGGNIDRPSLKRLIRDAQRHKLSKVLVYKLDRLSRSQKDALFLIEDVFIKNGVEFVSMSESLDTGSAQGKFFLGILASFAQLEREQIKERMFMGKEARAKSGKYSGNSSPPIGYDYDKASGYLVKNEDAPTVQMIYDLFLSGMRVSQITDKLNADGITHKRGTFSRTTIRNMLGTRIYLGELKHGDVWIKSRHEPLITEEMHEASCKILAKRKAEYDHNLRNGSVRSYLGGKLYCKWCGAKYSKSRCVSRDKWYEYYACNSRLKRDPKSVRDAECKNKRWRMDELDELIFGEIRKLRLEDAKPEKKDDQTPKVLESQIRKIDRQIMRLIDLYSLGSIDTDAIQSRINALNAQKANIELELEEWRNTHDIDLDALKRQITSMQEILDLGTREQKRKVIDALIDKIELDGEDITIYWRFHV